MILLLVQLVLPLILIAWLAFVPLESRAGRLVQAFAAAALLVAVQLAGMWLMPPWWTPWLLWLLYVGALLLSLRRPTGGRWPDRFGGWLALVLLTAVAGFGLRIAAQAAVARRAPAGVEAVALAFPMGPGRYYVANGGTAELVSSHARTLARRTEMARDYWGQSYGVDIVALGAWGMQAPSLQPRDPAAYAIFGEPVLAPCAGTVISTRDGLPDMPVPVMDKAHMTGNHVVLRCGGADILLAHLRQGSVAVREVQRVSVGEQVGEAGNSGNSSAPHLHIHAQRPGPEGRPFAGEPLAIRFRGRFPVRNDRI